MALFKIPFVLVSRKHLEAKISKRAMESCEQIITEMGAELHDDLIQKLSILRLNLDKIERSSYDKNEVQASISRMQTEFQSITESVRRISRRFFPIQKKEESLESSIQLLIQNFEMPGSLQINFTSSGTTVALTPFTQTYLIRMVQELIHNALRHSSAWKVWIRLNSEKDGLYLEVEDDGTAFSKLGEFVEMLNNKNNTLRMRADSIGATIKFVRGHKGLLAKIYLPLPQS